MATKRARDDTVAIDEDDIITDVRDMMAAVGANMNQGSSEHNYQLALGIEARLRGYRVQLEVPLPVVYKGESAGFVKPDMVLVHPDARQVVLELKAVLNISDNHRAQIRNYASLMHLRYGLLINFSQKRGAEPEMEVLPPF
jgi:GxxExxY protein